MSKFIVQEPVAKPIVPAGMYEAEFLGVEDFHSP